MTVFITDHALVRWLERAMDIDMEAFRQQLADIARPYAEARVKHAEVGGLYLVFEEAKLITVTPDKPTLGQIRKHDRHNRNHQAPRDTPLNWKALQRKRNHK